MEGKNGYSAPEALGAWKLQNLMEVKCLGERLGKASSFDCRVEQKKCSTGQNGARDQKGCKASEASNAACGMRTKGSDSTGQHGAGGWVLCLQHKATRLQSTTEASNFDFDMVAKKAASGGQKGLQNPRTLVSLIATTWKRESLCEADKCKKFQKGFRGGQMPRKETDVATHEARNFT